MDSKVEAAGIEPTGDLDATDKVSSSCENEGEVGAARALQSSVTSGHSLSPDDAVGQSECADELEGQIESIAHVWPNLPLYVRQAILMLVRAATCE